MSTRRQNFEATFEIHAGTEKQFAIEIVDPDTGSHKDLSDSTLYSDIVVKIYRPDGTILETLPGTFEDRQTGVVLFTVPPQTNENAGNWIGNVEFLNNGNTIVDQQFFGINILESY